MENRFQKFKESLQAPVRLSIAAEDYWKEPLTAEEAKAYSEYLKQRLRPAAQLLTEREDIERLEGLWNLEAFSPDLLEELLQLAISQHRNASYVWLLKKKQENVGFLPEEFLL